MASSLKTLLSPAKIVIGCLSVILLSLIYFSHSNENALAQNTGSDFGFNIHSLAKDSPDNITNILNMLDQNGVNTVRLWGFDQTFGIDGVNNIQRVLDAAPPDMQFIVSLEDFNYGAPSQQASWFSNQNAVDSYLQYSQDIVSKYKDASQILAWEIMNEPHCVGDVSCGEAFVQFMTRAARTIRLLDPDTLVSPGALFWDQPQLRSYYERVLSESGVTALDCHYYNTNNGSRDRCLDAAQLAQSLGLYFYIGEAGYKVGGAGHEGSATGENCTNVADEGSLQQRAGQIQNDRVAFNSVGAGAFVAWQFSPNGSPLLICDPFSFFPGDPLFEFNLLNYIPPPMPPGFSFFSQNFSCSVYKIGKPDDGEYRTDPCENCSLEVPEPVNSCAEETVLSKITEKITCGEVVECVSGYNQDGEPNLDYIYKETWGAVFNVDTTESLVPFVGFHETKKQDGRSQNLNQYLNDYFDGTSLYDKEQYSASDPVYQRNLVWEAGVWRKLAPQQVQDDLRIELIEQGYDYTVEQHPQKASMQDWGSAHFALIGLGGITNNGGRLPPDPLDPNYIHAYAAWQATEWGQYWHYLPMFTREDAPGKAILAIQSEPGTLDPGPDGANQQANIAEVPLSIPHLSRLYGVTQSLNQLLMPEIQAADTGLPITPRSVTTGPDNVCASGYGPGYMTALGCIPTQAAGFVAWLLQWGSMAGGGIAFLIIAWGALSMITAAGQPEPIQFGRTLIIAGVVGLLTIIFGVMILRWVMRDILEIPGVVFETSSTYQLAHSRKKPTLSSWIVDPTESQTVTRKAESKTVKPVGNIAIHHTPYLPADATVLQAGNLQPNKILLAQAHVESDTLALGPLLAQADTGIIAQGDQCEGMRMIVHEENGGIQIHAWNTMEAACGDPSDYSFTVNYYWDGERIGGCSEYVGGGNYLPRFNSGGTPEEQYGLWINGMSNGRCAIPRSPSPGWEQHLNVEYQVHNSHASTDPGCTKSPSCNCPPDDPSCSAPPPVTPQPPPLCRNPDQFSPGQCSVSGETDPNPDLDPVCCSQQTTAMAPNYITPIGRRLRDQLCCTGEMEELGQCRNSYSAGQFRDLGVDLELPYLKKAWDYTGAQHTGVFQIFNPSQMLEFPDTDAKSGIGYKVTQTLPENAEQEAQFTPDTGEMEWPFLYGIHKSKKCISEVLLTPQSLQEPTGVQEWCDFRNNEPTGFETLIQ